MNRTTKIKITELNPHVICVLCGGYYINATTITECLHSFCRTCITRYLETSKYCPICDVMVHKTRPLDYIRSDKTLQDLVYKLVPGLYKSEMKRRRDYYAQHPGAETLPPSEDRGVEFHDRIIYTEDEKISLSLELCAEGVPFKTPSAIHGHNGPDNIKISDVRYLVCPAAFSVGNLKKFIRMKFDLKPKYEVDIFQTAEPLADYYTLMDIAYIYTWTRRAPLRLYYTVYERLIAPKVPAIVSKRQPAIVNGENISCVSSNQETREESHGIKRKHEDGPDDVSFDLSADTPEKTDEPKKVPCNARKNNKKNVDSTVLEAVSKSEEILAKLTLNCSNDADGLVQDSEEEHKSTDDESKAPGNIGKLCTSTPVPASLISKDHSPLSLSRFEPLNGEPSSVNVYDFHSQELGSSVELNKTKGKRGRKKKIVTERDKKEPEYSNEGDISLVISDKHPGIKATTPKKEVKKHKKLPASDHLESKVQMTNKTKPQAVNRGKAKTVKEILDSAQRNGHSDDKVPKKRGRKPGSVNKVKKVKLVEDGKDRQNGTDCDSKSQLSANEHITNNDPQSAVSVRTIAASNETEIDSSVNSLIDNVDTALREPSLNETDSKTYNNIEEPVTPPYGQTPKPAELNPGLPVSVNTGGVIGDQNGAINVGINNGVFVPSMNGIGALNGHEFRPYLNGYIPGMDNSDQPLDLTNNTHRSEYTKGKIFKTKLLKKTVSKSDSLTDSGERGIQTGHNAFNSVTD